MIDDVLVGATLVLGCAWPGLALFVVNAYLSRRSSDRRWGTAPVREVTSSNPAAGLEVLTVRYRRTLLGLLATDSAALVALLVIGILRT